MEQDDAQSEASTVELNLPSILLPTTTGGVKHVPDVCLRPVPPPFIGDEQTKTELMSVPNPLR